MDFASALREQIVTRKRRGIVARRLLELIDSKPSNRRTRILAVLEEHATVHLRAAGVRGLIDWSKIDWNRFFENLFKLLMVLLPLLL